MKKTDGTCKFMGDKYWKIKIDRDMTWEEYVEVVGHELMHYLIESFRKDDYPENIVKGDHKVCATISSKLKRLIVKRLKETKKHTNLTMGR